MKSRSSGAAFPESIQTTGHNFTSPPLNAAAAVVAQVSEPAVSPISTRQGARGREVCGLETRDTADLEIGATAAARSCTPENGRFLRLRGGRIVGRCAHGRAIADKMRQFTRKLFSHGYDRLSSVDISQQRFRLIFRFSPTNATQVVAHSVI